MPDPAADAPSGRATPESAAQASRRRFFRAGLVLHLAVLAWWPFSVQIAARSPALFPETIHAYLLTSALLYPLFVAAAFYFGRKGLRKPDLQALLPIALLLPFLSGTWWMLVVLAASVVL